MAEVIRTTLAMYLVVSALIGLGLFFGSRSLIIHVFSLEPRNVELAVAVLQITAWGLVFYFADMSFDAALRGFERFDFAVSLRLFAGICTHGGRITLVLAGYGIKSLITLTVCVIIVEAVLKALVIRRSLVRNFIPIPIFSFTSFREICSFSFFTWVSDLALLIRNNGESVIIGALLGTRYVTYYSIAKSLVEQIVALINKTFAFVFPAVSKLAALGERQYIIREFTRLSLMALGVGVPIICPIAYLSFPLLTLWIGSEVSSPTYVILKILCVAFALSPLGVINGNYLLALGEVRLMSLINVTATFVTLSAIVAGVHYWGIIGAALAQCLNIGFVFINQVLVQRKVTGNYQLSGVISIGAWTLVPVSLCAIAPYHNIFGRAYLDIFVWGLLISGASTALFLLMSRRVSYVPRSSALRPASDSSMRAHEGSLETAK